jgi:transcriptional regulator with XRE-family HTH domain
MTTRHEAETLTLTGHAEMTIDYRKIFSQRLYDMIMEKQVSQAEVGRNTGISKDMISRYVKGETRPGEANLLKLAKYFNVEPSQLMPSRLDNRGDEGEAEFYTRLSTDEHSPRFSLLELRRVIRTATALKIMQLIDEDTGTRLEKVSDNGGKASN